MTKNVNNQIKKEFAHEIWENKDLRLKIIKELGKHERTLHRYLFENSRIIYKDLMLLKSNLAEHYKKKKILCRKEIKECNRNLKIIKTKFITE